MISKLEEISYKLSSRLLFILIGSSILAAICFSILYSGRNLIFATFRKAAINSFDYHGYENKIQNQVKDIELSEANAVKIEAILSSSLQDSNPRHIGVSVYDDSDLYVCGVQAEVVDQFLVGGIYDASAMVSPEPAQLKVKFKNQTATLLVYYYGIHKLAYPYLGFCILVSLTLFLFPVLRFINRKMQHITQLQKEIQNMAAGDLQHEIHATGNDEIGLLGKNLDGLRKILDTNIRKEQQAMDANRELITTLSHDIRTPLTTLKGYLEIIRLGKFQSQAQCQQYLERCLDKVDQISSISNKMFEYALVFGGSDAPELELMDTGLLISMLQEETELLEMEGFKLDVRTEQPAACIYANLQMLRRVFSNLVSNILKYAQKAYPVSITLLTAEHQLYLSLSNYKRDVSELLESNHIGLKSVEKIIHLHQGVFQIKDEENTFTVIIRLPLASKKQCSAKSFQNADTAPL